jgi:ferritin-like metal-binding protein YciE
MVNDQDLLDLFHRKLREMWFSEKKIHNSLPKMANAAQSDALRAAFKKHEAETQRQIARLGNIFGLIDRGAKEESSIALAALLDEGTEAMVKFKNSSALDAALIAGAQAIEHHEIACYGTLKAWAEQLGMQDAVDLLDETLTEEKDTDKALTNLAEEMANEKAKKDGVRETDHDAPVGVATSATTERSESKPARKVVAATKKPISLKERTVKAKGTRRKGRN